MRLFFLAIAAGIFSTCLCGCFTGVESAPKITGRDIRRHGAAAVTPEAGILDAVADSALSLPAPGKRYVVADNRLSLLLTDSVGRAVDNAVAVGDTLTCSRVFSGNSITGGTQILLAFDTSRNQHVVFHTGVSETDFSKLSSFQIPCSVSLESVSIARNILVGKSVYYLPARRMLADGKEIDGLRYQPVTIVDVLPGTETMPLQIVFRQNDGTEASTFISVGIERTATRNFERVFAIADPRNKYRDIQDDVWQLIVNSQVREGMTPRECKLALGDPHAYRQVPSTMGMVEQWSYDDGTYLFFEDGTLRRFRR